MSDVLRAKRARAGAAEIAYDERGPSRGPTLLCLPGWAVSRTFFGPLAEELAPRWRVVTLDWRGHGGSGRADGDVGHEELAADALAVVEATGARDLVIVAQAHGGWIAIELCRRLGRRV